MREKGRSGGDQLSPLHPIRVSPNLATPPHPPTVAEALQTRAERRAGSDPAAAIALFEEAATGFRAVLAAPGLSADAAADAACGLGECLQKKGEAILAAADREVAAGPDTQPAASAAACAAFEGAVAAYARVPGPVHAPLGGGGRHPALALRPDAAVNAANTLCAWAAEVGGGVAAADRLATAVALYRGALAAEAGAVATGEALPDAGTATNLADALAQAAALAGTRDAFAEADAAYAAAVGACSSDNGDDLPGLLLNWAAATAAGAGALGGDPALLATAAARFREAAAFGRGDPAPLAGLGDTLVEMAGVAAAAAGGAGALAGADPESAALLTAALDQGFRPALALDRRFADAHAGCGDVFLAQSRATQVRGDAGAAVALASESAAAYGRALDVPPTSPRSLGGWRARAEAGWNRACALALAGEGDACVGVLHGLLAREPGLVGEVLADADLAGCAAVRAAVGAG